MDDAPLRMDDDPLDDALQAAAREYHRPPDTPRAAMWREIEGARRVELVRRQAAQRWGEWTAGAAAAAAAAVLALGIGIGRMSRHGLESPLVASADWTAAPRVNGTAYRLATVEHLGHTRLGCGSHDSHSPSGCKQGAAYLSSQTSCIRA